MSLDTCEMETKYDKNCSFKFISVLVYRSNARTNDRLEKDWPTFYWGIIISNWYAFTPFQRAAKKLILKNE